MHKMPEEEVVPLSPLMQWVCHFPRMWEPQVQIIPLPDLEQGYESLLVGERPKRQTTEHSGVGLSVSPVQMVPWCINN